MVIQRKELDEELALLASDFQVELISSDTGWSNHDAFFRWAVNTFNTSVMRHRRSPDEHSLLLTDGSTTHETEAAIEEMRKANIHALIFPSRSSHILQPCDMYVLANLKSAFNRMSQPSNQYQAFIQVFSSIQSGTSAMTVIASWSRASLWPLNECNITSNTCVVTNGAF